ncbi:MAG: OmpA family protein [Myxococcales bacterium]|nr:OmpA family protein [Myxococcales bacterium]
MKSRRSLVAALLLLLALITPQSVHAQDDDADLAADATAKKKPEPKGDDEDPAVRAPTIHGLSGLFRTVTGDIGTAHSFRVGLHTELFSGSDFLVQNDSNSRFRGTLSINYTPWRMLEFFAYFTSQANSNDRTDPNRLDQDVILALGDFGFGGKFFFPIHKAFGLGARIGVDFLNSVGGVSIDGDSIGFHIGLISTLDLDPLANFPLRFHFNFGFQLDNSQKLAVFNNYPLESLQVEKFALGINPSRLQIRFGLDLPLRKYLGSWGLTPIIEINLDVATGGEDPDFADPRFLVTNGGPLTADDIAGRLTAWLTFGARVSPVRGLNLELAVDVGAQSPGYGFGPPVLPWNMILGVSYAYEAKQRVKVVTKTKVKRVRVGPPPRKIGKIRGRIINAKTLAPVEGAIVTFPGRDLTGLSSDPDGSFLSYELPPGKLPIVVRHPDYKPGKVMGVVTIDKTVKLEIKLQPAPPKTGKVTGRVQNRKAAAVSGATIEIVGTENKSVTTTADGAFNAELKPGSYTLKIAADGYLRKVSQVALTAGATANLDITLTKRPRRSAVRITRRLIRLRRKVHFATGTANLKEDAKQLLDQVVDVMLANPQIKLVEIGGHTDNRGGRAANMTLSNNRATAVRDYLIAGGVPADRLVAKGYGPTRPKVPNITARNRARNRRVEFRIKRQ